MKYEITTSPAAEPVTLEEAKAQLRVDVNDEDNLIQTLITVARRKVESETGRVLISQTVKAYWEKWPASGVLTLPVYPASAITNIKYIDEDGTLQTWDSANYTADLVGMTPRIMINPDVDAPDTGEYPNAIQVTYTAGASTAADVPAEIKHSILVTLAMLYERREDMKINENTPGIRTASWLQFNHRANLI